MTFGEAVKAARQSRNLTQEVAARDLGVSVMTLSKWETGKHVPRYAMVEKIIEAFPEIADAAPPAPAPDPLLARLDRIEARQEELDRRTGERKAAARAAGEEPKFSELLAAMAHDGWELDLAAGRKLLNGLGGGEPLYGRVAFQNRYGLEDGEPDIIAAAITALAERVAVLEAKLADPALALAAQAGATADEDAAPAAEVIKRARARRAQ